MPAYGHRHPPRSRCPRLPARELPDARPEGLTGAPSTTRAWVTLSGEGGSGFPGLPAGYPAARHPLWCTWYPHPHTGRNQTPSRYGPSPRCDVRAGPPVPEVAPPSPNRDEATPTSSPRPLELRQADHQPPQSLHRQSQCHSGTRPEPIARLEAVAAMVPGPDGDQEPPAGQLTEQMHVRPRRSLHARSENVIFLSQGARPTARVQPHLEAGLAVQTPVRRVWVVEPRSPTRCHPATNVARWSGKQPGAHLPDRDPCRAQHQDHGASGLTSLVALAEGGPDVVRPIWSVLSPARRFVSKGDASLSEPQAIRSASRKGLPR